MIGFLGIGSHAKLKTLLSSYIDGEVSPDERARVEQHLSGCDECRRDLETLRMSVGLLRDLPELQAPRSFRLRAAPEPVRAFGRLVWATGLATSAAAMLLAALVVGDALEVFRQAGQSELASFSTALTAEAPAAPGAAPLPPVAAQAVSAPAMADALEGAAAAAELFDEPGPAEPESATAMAATTAEEPVEEPVIDELEIEPAMSAAAEPVEEPALVQRAAAPAMAADSSADDTKETDPPIEKAAAAASLATPAKSDIDEVPRRDSESPAPMIEAPTAAAEAEPVQEAEGARADGAPEVRPAQALQQAAIGADVGLGPEPSAAENLTEDILEGVALPLRELQLAAAILAAMLLAATVVLARRRRAPSR